MKRPIPLSARIDELQSTGRYVFTVADLDLNGDRSLIATQAALRRLNKRGRIASPRRGFHVIVPIEYREAGCPPPSWFIDDLMGYLGQPYYVALLSAAGLHGAAHQQPMVFQVITDRATRPMRVGRVGIEFHVSRVVREIPVTEVQTETGTMRVSVPEATAFDLVRFQGSAGQLRNVATILDELGEQLDSEVLVQLAPLYKLPDVQRLGYLLDQVGHRQLAAPLRQWLKGRRYRAVPLRSGWEVRDRSPDSRWRVIPNEEVEVDG